MTVLQILQSRIKEGQPYAAVRARINETIRQGALDYQDEQPLACCPYPADSENAVLWREGWKAADKEAWG